MKHTVKKYLDTYADLRALPALELVEPKRFVMVIPAFKEGMSFLDAITRFQSYSQPALIVVVVNEPHDAREDEKTINRELVTNLERLSASSRKNACSVIAVGPYQLPRVKGVGLARKIGADAALYLIEKQLIKEPIIYSTDADAKLPKDYFERALQAWTKTSAAFVYPFKHELPEDQNQALAIMLYEKRLNDYVAGLRAAHSPYAFHTIGSTIAVSAAHYAQARGFPSLAAGEDFYILNKLRKLGDIISLDGDPIKLSARVSDRVAFGTGPALAKILRDDPKNALLFYDQRVFLALKQFLGIVHDCLNAHNLNFLSLLPENILQAFISLDPEKFMSNLSIRKTTDDRIKAFHDYFDAFRTLKFIHYLRDNYFPNHNFYDEP